MVIVAATVQRPSRLQAGPGTLDTSFDPDAALGTACCSASFSGVGRYHLARLEGDLASPVVGQLRPPGFRRPTRVSGRGRT